MDHGHPEARFYPLSMVWEEVEIVTVRLNQQEASRTVLMQLAVSSIISKEGGKLLDKTLKVLTDGE